MTHDEERHRSPTIPSHFFSGLVRGISLEDMLTVHRDLSRLSADDIFYSDRNLATIRFPRDTMVTLLPRLSFLQSVESFLDFLQVSVVYQLAECFADIRVVSSRCFHQLTGTEFIRILRPKVIQDVHPHLTGRHI